jgi:predicted RNA binding protein YcfA (HicA-like mRNA interferase family)
MDFRQAREQVSIVQIAEHLGYAYDKSKGIIRPQYKHPNGDRIIISHPNDNSRQMYFNRDGSTDRGSVIDFIKHRLANFPTLSYQKDMDGVNQVLRQFANEPIVTPQYKNEFSLEKQPFDITAFIIKDISLTSKEVDYLTSRNLNAQTIKAFEKHVHSVKDNYAKGEYVNVGFAYKNKHDTIVGFEVRNNNFKAHARGSDKDTGVWKAAMRPFTEQIKDVFLFEGAIDAMSFYQIYHTKFNFKDAAFVSFGGAITPNQMDNVLHTYQNARFYSGFDNDVNGHIYDYAFEKQLNPKFDIDVKRVGEEFVIKHKSNEYKLPYEDFSMKKVVEMTHQKLKLYITKPSLGKDYNEMLRGLKEDMSERRKVKY